jgi:serine/threonine protein kinase
LCDNKDLAKLIKSKGKLSEEASIGIMKQIINGLANLQKHRIIHRDLKPMNIFFKNGVVKIADFGFAFKDGTPVQKYNLGSPSYMPPEVLRDNKYSFKSDIWALGVIMY